MKKTELDRQKVHDIKSTLTALMGYMELLEKELSNTKQSDATKNYVQSLKAAIESIQKQIMELGQEISSDIL